VTNVDLIRTSVDPVVGTDRSAADEYLGVLPKRVRLQLTYLEHARVRLGVAEPVAEIESSWVDHEGLVSSS
jgi:hypothetical protein